MVLRDSNNLSLNLCINSIIWKKKNDKTIERKIDQVMPLTICHPIKCWLWTPWLPLIRNGTGPTNDFATFLYRYNVCIIVWQRSTKVIWLSLNHCLSALKVLLLLFKTSQKYMHLIKPKKLKVKGKWRKIMTFFYRS